MELRVIATCIAALVLTPAAAQMNVPPSSAAPASPSTCAECGVIRSIRRVETKPRTKPDERKAPSGLVANIPFDGKPSIGSSTDLRRSEEMPVVTYEVVVRLDDGRLQVVIQDEVGAMREGDPVKVERGQVVLRGR